LFFREESEIDVWCTTHGRERGAILTLEQVWELATLWYSDRMQSDFRGRTADSARQIFKQMQFNDSFWEF